MPVSDYFGATYADARDKFRTAARGAHARLSCYELPGHRGPSGEELSVDVGVIGSEKARRGLLLIAGTHGAEGFCGSGCQVGFFADRLYEAFGGDAVVLLVHAINPYGFAWLRRVNEDNVDLNRNFRDFTQPPPASTAYEALHDHLVPVEWQGPAREAADAALMAYIRERGMRAFQAAVSEGQYSRPTGLFYGGARETWSAQTIRAILKEHVPATLESLAVIDLHTGLGPAAYGEPIHIGDTAEDYRRAVSWYGSDVRNITGGDSVSAEVVGTMYSGVRSSLNAAVQLTYVALEFGTKPINEVLTALRADHWLHAVANRDTPLRAGISRQVRDAFFVDTPAWKAATYGRTADMIVRTARCLSA
jgi:predicted deacylase